MKRTTLLLVGVAGIALGLWTAWEPYQFTGALQSAPGTTLDAIRFLVVGWCYLGIGMALSARRPGNRIGPLLIFYGFAWFASHIAGAGPRLPLAAEVVAVALARWKNPILVWIALSFPSGRLPGRAERGVLWFTWLWIFISGPLWGFAVVRQDAGLISSLDRVRTPLIAMIALSVIVLIVWRILRASAPARRGLVPAWSAAGVVALGFVVGGIETVGNLSAEQRYGLTVLTEWATIFIPIAYVYGLLRLAHPSAGVGKFVLELADPPRPAKLRDALARTLGDPTLEVGFWLPEADGYVDIDGRPFDLPEGGSGRSVAVLERGGAPLAAFVYDATLAEAPELVASVGAATSLALENERLQAAVRAQLAEVRASRQRIVEAADAERRRVERNLHDGAQQRLMTVALALRRALRRLKDEPDIAESVLMQATQELNAAVEELRELARGIHPAILTNEGLGPALESVADRCPVPVQMRVDLTDRVSESVEATAYFVISEALANVAKHAHAHRVTVDVHREDERLCIEVADDGIGGADPERGSGLRGLSDRVAAIGGRFEVESKDGGGTRVRAELPCG